ncbi:hypothetical protein [Streptomyces goshikiensis]|uniref:hypothetical protein n=1 Tax=Streptomyces goshikiensis TaxID=1942 RepID=UPI0022F403A1|nr:hypothetical protein [Streptomyces goshikiensis]WBY22054.1 hypothetical protein PET44_21960 [Streptomyces goshikiensis]WSS00836.1 hypothetical protein OG224_23895 [Streptomyces goshikiensis]
MRGLRVVGAALVSVVVLCACGAGGGSGEASASPTASATPSASAPPSPSPSPSPAESLVRMTRTGGFAGRTSSVLVKGDGSWTRLDGDAKPTGSGKLTPEELERLRSALAAADFAHLPRVSKSGTPVYDGFEYTIVHGGFEVVTADGSVPPSLQDVLSALPPSEG